MEVADFLNKRFKHVPIKCKLIKTTSTTYFTQLSNTRIKH